MIRLMAARLAGQQTRYLSQHSPNGGLTPTAIT
jgi:hypothetical protein